MDGNGPKQNTTFYQILLSSFEINMWTDGKIWSLHHLFTCGIKFCAECVCTAPFEMSRPASASEKDGQQQLSSPFV
jgi:hypothetical protein